MPGPVTKALGARLLALAAIVGAFAVFVALTGGIDTRIGGIPVRSRSWDRPAVIAAFLAAAGALAYWREILAFLRRCVDPLVRTVRWMFGALPLAAICWAGIAAIAFGTFAAGGSDSYGYISQAELLADGKLTYTVPRNPAFTWPDVPRTLMPLGYTRGTRPDTLAPIYAPGLPLLMAPLAMLHPNAVFLLVPLCAVAAVFLCWRLGRHLGEAAAGALAATLLALSPTFLYQAVQPMSDVPVTACWLGALLVARRRTRFAAPLSGLLASLAILIRPNLAPLAMFVVAASAMHEDELDRRRATLSAIAMIPGVLLLALIQNARYGSPLASGYGPFSDLFALENVVPNLSRYPRWLTEMHTPFIWLWLAAPAWFARTRAVRVFGWIAWAFCLAVLAAYMPYVYFQPQEWFYTRFLLPAVPLMLLLATATALHAARRLSPRLGTVAVVLLVLGVAAYGAFKSRDAGVFGLHGVERKYPAVGAFVRERLPESAYVFAMQHSGSVKYYSGRQTVRWDLLDRASLDRAVTALRASGHEPYAVLDLDEEEEFRKRFESAAQQAVGRMVPIATIGHSRVYAFQ